MANQSVPLTLPALVAHNATRYGDREAIKDGQVRLSWIAIDHARRRIAKALIAAGIRKGDRIAVWAPNIHEYVLAAVGVHSLGAILVPLNTRFKGLEAGDILRNSNARILFTIDHFLGVDYPGLLKDEKLPELEKIVLLRGIRAGCTAWEEFLGAGDAVADAEVDRFAAGVVPDDVMDLMFTSGTTGKPKGALLTHGQNIRVYTSFGQMLGLEESDSCLVIPPFFHSFGYKSGWLCCMIHGMRMVPAPIFDLDKLLPMIAEERISVLPGPPTLYHSLLVHPQFKKHDLSSLRVAFTGAAVVPVELVKRMYSELGFREVFTGYGLTETCGTVTMCLKGDDPVTVATTSGRPIPDIEVKVVDADGRERPRGEPGEVLVRGYNVMKAYFNDPQETAKAIDAEGFLHTGDIGVMDARGYLTITDRLKDMYIVGGFNCYPVEIENMLLTMPGVAQASVIGVPDERQGEVGKAFIIARPDAKLNEEGVIAWCREHMANFKVPRYVELVEAFPLNATGKVQKTELRKRGFRGG